MQQGPLSSQRYGGHMEARASDASSEDDDNDDEASHVICDVDGGYHDAPNNLQEDIDVDAERALSGTFSESSGNLGSNPFHHKVSHKMNIRIPCFPFNFSSIQQSKNSHLASPLVPVKYREFVRNVIKRVICYSSRNVSDAWREFGSEVTFKHVFVWL